MGVKFIFLSRLTRHSGRLTPARRTIWTGLGIYWLISGVEQIPPQMGFPWSPAWHNGPQIVGQPLWISHMMTSGFHAWAVDPAGMNILSVSLQIIIGLLLITRYETIVGSIAVGLSIAVSLVNWIWGGGFGGLFTGHASFVFGAPGSGILAILPAILLLVPSIQLTSHAVKMFWRIVLVIGIALQIQPALWTSSGWLANIPSHDTSWLSPVTHIMSTDPVLSNSIVVILLGANLLLWFKSKPNGLTVGYSALMWLAFLVMGQGAGLLRAEYALDFNSAALAILGTMVSAIALRNNNNERRDQPMFHPDPSPSYQPSL